MLNSLLSIEQSMSLIHECQIKNVKILGIDGFICTGKGNIASLDLILDLSKKKISAAQSCEEAKSFISANARKDILFEICVE